MKRNKLDIGCGARPMTGKDWDCMDVRKEIPMFDHSVFYPNIVADVLEGIPREDGYYDEIKLSSMLEHFNKKEVHKVMSECTRVLSPGGKIWISVPDMGLIADRLFNANSDREVNHLINLVYGEHDYEENAHKWGYTEKSLRDLLAKYNFVNIARLESKQYICELVLEGIYIKTKYTL